MKLSTFMNIYWPIWLLIGFGVPEAIALFTKQYGNTLSEWTWRLCKVTPGDTWTHWTFLHILLAAAMFWLTVHLVLGIWR